MKLFQLPSNCPTTCTFFIFLHPYYFCQAFLTSHDYRWVPQTPCNGKLWMLVYTDFSGACPKLWKRNPLSATKYKCRAWLKKALSHTWLERGKVPRGSTIHACSDFILLQAPAFWPVLEKACWAGKILDRQFLHHEQRTQHFSSVLLLQR